MAIADRMMKEKSPKESGGKADKTVMIEIPQGQFPVVLYANTFGLESLDGHKVVHFGLMLPPAWPLGRAFSKETLLKAVRIHG